MAQVLDRALCPVLVGRSSQLETLEDALLAANRGDGQVVVLAGEAGMGKSRLAEELRAVAQRAGTVVMEGSCSEAELALPYLPFFEAIGNYLSIADLEGLRERLGPFRRELAQLFPQVDPDAAHGDGGDPTQGRLRLFEALIALLRIPADEHGLLLIIEDIHWADASTRELLDYMTRRLRTTRIMVLATYRSDELHRRHPLLPLVQGWRRSGTARIVELEPLKPDGIAEMVKAIFDEEEVSDEFRDFLYARSEGNPFVAEELLKDALDRGDIYRTDAGWERRELAELSLPRTVTDSVLLRLERLGDDDVEILQAAAVLGRSFDYRTLAAVAGPSEERVQEGLHLFVQQQLMDEESNASRYRFRHALTREAIYADLISPRRLLLHGRAADALKAIRGTPQVDLAYHLLEAGRHAQAVPVVLEAAVDAERRFGFEEAVALYERIVPFVEDETERARLQGRLGRALYWSRQGGRAKRFLEEGIPVLERHGLVAEAAGLRLWLGRLYWESARPEDARLEYETVRDQLEPLGPSGDLATTYMRLAGLRLFELDGTGTIELASRAREIAEAAQDDAARIWADVFIASGMETVASTRAQAYERLEAARSEAMERGYPWIAGNALFNELETRIWRYEAQIALERAPLMRDLQIRFAGGDSPWIPYLEGCAFVTMGEPAAAHAALTRAIADAEAAGFTTFVGWSRRTDALALSMLDRHAEARAALPDIAAGLERQDAVPVSAHRLRVLFDAGDSNDAAEEIEAAVALLARRPSDWVIEEARLAEEIVEVALAAGRTEVAAAVLDLIGPSGMPVDDPYRLRTEGRWALAQGDARRAAELLARAASGFARVAYRDDEWRARRALGDAFLTEGDAPAAERELRQVLLEAQEHGHVAEARRAREAMSRLGPRGTADSAVPSPSVGSKRGGLGPAATAPSASRTRGTRRRRAAGGPAAAAPSADRRRGGPRAGANEARSLRQSGRHAERSAVDVGPGRTRPTEVVATILFLDVRGYTELTGRRVPQDQVERLAALHRWAKREVERHHGIVDKFAGDAVMAVFNASGARLDHAVHALQAALAIRDKAAYAGMPVGIGLATGPAVVGPLTDGANVSAIGETTNRAARLQASAGAGQILLDEEAHRRVAAWLRGRHLDAARRELQLKGFDRPIVAFHLG